VCGQEPAREDAGAPLVGKNKSVLTSGSHANNESMMANIE
jgi:hypothetical protein